MKLTGNWLILGVVVLVLTGSCFDPPQYSPVPTIEFNDLYFKKGTVTDTLSIAIKFKDGDGDVGLAQGDTLSPYNNRFYPRFPNNRLVNYKAKRKYPAYDTLPAYVKPYYCTNWQIITYDSVVRVGNVTTRLKVRDTVFYYSNPNYYNIFVDFYIQDGITGEYVLYDLEKEFAGANCGISYDGRLPVLSKDLTRKSALEGTIRYNMKSQAFTAIFGSRAFKLRVKIQDRALNKSNVIETLPDNLAHLTRN